MTKEEIGDKIAKRMIQLGLTQEQLAKKINDSKLSNNKISQITLGKRNVSISEFVQICSALNISVDDMLNEDKFSRIITVKLLLLIKNDILSFINQNENKLSNYIENLIYEDLRILTRDYYLFGTKSFFPINLKDEILIEIASKVSTFYGECIVIRDIDEVGIKFIFNSYTETETEPPTRRWIISIGPNFSVDAWFYWLAYKSDDEYETRCQRDFYAKIDTIKIIDKILDKRWWTDINPRFRTNKNHKIIEMNGKLQFVN